MVDRESINEALDHLRYDRDLLFDMLVELFAVDYTGKNRVSRSSTSSARRGTTQG
jgi:hypothetical protein